MSLCRLGKLADGQVLVCVGRAPSQFHGQFVCVWYPDGCINYSHADSGWFQRLTRRGRLSLCSLGAVYWIDRFIIPSRALPCNYRPRNVSVE